jgi:hypothetical protein
MSIRFLKVKLKSLAAESRIIRLEETRSRGTLRCSLREHRVGIVRSEARHTHLAYGYLRGHALAVLEPQVSSIPDWERVRKMVKKYGTAAQLEAFDAWRGVLEQKVA